MSKENPEGEGDLYPPEGHCYPTEYDMRLVTIADIVNLAKVSRRQIEQMKADGLLPAPVTTTGFRHGRAKSWRILEIRPILEKHFGVELTYPGLARFFGEDEEN